MIPKGLFTQIAMVVLSIAIIFTYVKPAFDEIRSVQDDIGVYQTEHSKIISVNDKLSTLVNQLESVSNEDQRRLSTYLPDTVDSIAVQRDLKFITSEAGVVYKNVSYESDATNKPARREVEESENAPQAHSFLLSVEGRYEQLKNLFELLEQNNYPLEIQTVEIEQAEGGFLTASIQIATYTYQSPLNNN